MLDFWVSTSAFWLCCLVRGCEQPSSRLSLQHTLPVQTNDFLLQRDAQPETALPCFHIHSFLFSQVILLLLTSAFYKMLLIAEQMIVEGSLYTRKLSYWELHLLSAIQIYLHGASILVGGKTYFLFCL